MSDLGREQPTVGSRPSPPVGRRRFTATLQGTTGSDATYVLVPDSVKLGPSHRLIRVRGTIDGLAFHSTYTATRAGRARLTVRPDICRRLGKRAGDRVTVVIHTSTADHHG